VRRTLAVVGFGALLAAAACAAADEYRAGDHRLALGSSVTEASSFEQAAAYVVVVGAFGTGLGLLASRLHPQPRPRDHRPPEVRW
jgi:hypothetical protein